MRDVDWVKRDNSQNTPMTNQCLFYAYECGCEEAVCVNYRTQNSKMAMATPSLYHLALSADEMQFRALCHYAYDIRNPLFCTVSDNLCSVKDLVHPELKLDMCVIIKNPTQTITLGSVVNMMR